MAVIEELKYDYLDHPEYAGLGKLIVDGLGAFIERGDRVFALTGDPVLVARALKTYHKSETPMTDLRLTTIPDQVIADYLVKMRNRT